MVCLQAALRVQLLHRVSNGRPHNALVPFPLCSVPCLFTLLFCSCCHRVYSYAWFPLFRCRTFVAVSPFPLPFPYTAAVAAAVAYLLAVYGCNGTEFSYFYRTMEFYNARKAKRQLKNGNGMVETRHSLGQGRSAGVSDIALCKAVIISSTSTSLASSSPAANRRQTDNDDLQLPAPSGTVLPDCRICISVSFVVGRWQLRSADSGSLVVPRTRTTAWKNFDEILGGVSRSG